jgi:hypothetical protein
MYLIFYYVYISYKNRLQNAYIGYKNRRNNFLIKLLMHFYMIIKYNIKNKKFNIFLRKYMSCIIFRYIERAKFQLLF